MITNRYGVPYWRGSPVGINKRVPRNYIAVVDTPPSRYYSPYYPRENGYYVQSLDVIRDYEKLLKWSSASFSNPVQTSLMRGDGYPTKPHHIAVQYFMDKRSFDKWLDEKSPKGTPSFFETAMKVKVSEATEEAKRALNKYNYWGWDVESGRSMDLLQEADMKPDFYIFEVRKYPGARKVRRAYQDYSLNPAADGTQYYNAHVGTKTAVYSPGDVEDISHHKVKDWAPETPPMLYHITYRDQHLALKTVWATEYVVSPLYYARVSGPSMTITAVDNPDGTSYKVELETTAAIVSIYRYDPEGAVKVW